MATASSCFECRSETRFSIKGWMSQNLSEIERLSSALSAVCVFFTAVKDSR